MKFFEKGCDKASLFCINHIRREQNCAMFNQTSVNGIKTDWDSESIDQCLFRIAKKDLSAMEELYCRTNASVYGFALSVLKNSYDAEDVLHDLYVLVYSAAGTYRSEGRPMAWIFTITKNLCLQKLRDHKRTADFPEEDWERYIAANPRMSSEDKLILSECMKSLSDEERQIVVLHAVFGFKHREIAKMLALPLSTVLSKYNRALKKLRKVCEGER